MKDKDDGLGENGVGMERMMVVARTGLDVNIQVREGGREGWRPVSRTLTGNKGSTEAKTGGTLLEHEPAFLASTQGRKTTFTIVKNIPVCLYTSTSAMGQFTKFQLYTKKITF